MASISNPRVVDIAGRVNRLVEIEKVPFLSAVSRIAESLDISPSTVDSCYATFLSGVDVDPYDTGVDDWSEDYWR